MDKLELKTQIQQLATEAGFLRPRFTHAPEGVWMMAGFHYLPADDVSRQYFGLFACHDNYDYAVKTMKNLRRSLAELTSLSAKSMRIICNSQEDERALAESAGVGYRGKNSLIIIPDWGSFCVLIGLFIPLDLDTDAPLDKNEFQCGECLACRKSCPVNALHTAYQLDIPKCAQYWASNGLQPPQELKDSAPLMIYGCDRCQNCCPKNKPAITFYQKHAQLADPSPWADLNLWIAQDSQPLYEVLKKSPMRFSWLDKENLRVNAKRIYAAVQKKLDPTEIEQ